MNYLQQIILLEETNIDFIDWWNSQSTTQQQHNIGTMETAPYQVMTVLAMSVDNRAHTKGMVLSDDKLVDAMSIKYHSFDESGDNLLETIKWFANPKTDIIAWLRENDIAQMIH